MDFLRYLKSFKLMAPEGGGAGGGEGSNGGSDSGNDGEGNNTPPAEKTFTQEQLNSIVAGEKKKNIASAYKDLGFKDAEEAKAFIEKYREAEEQKKDDLTKAQEKVTNLEEEKKAEATKVKRLEHKFKAVEAGCHASKADDVVLLTMARVDEDTDFDTALTAIKEAYPGMFTSDDSGNQGTGTGGTHPRGKKKITSGLGERLAQQRTSVNQKKSTFFKD